MFPHISPDLTPIFARFVDDRSPWDVSRMGGAERPALWSALVEEVGAAGLLVGEDHGGQGATLVELASAVAETARCGWSGPLVATAGVAATLLHTLDSDDDSGLLAAIAEDGAIVVVALHEDAHGVSLDTTVRATPAGTGVLLDGRRTFVDSGAHADILLVPAVDDDGALVLARVDANAAGVTRTVMDAVDPGRGLAVIELADVEAAIVARGDGIPQALHDAWLIGALLTSIDLLAASERALTLSLDYARIREQFGRPVASFQSIKHKLVDMWGDQQTALSAVHTAIALAADADSRAAVDWRFAASAAKARVGDAALHVLRESVQVHGGIGFTWEHEVSHHFRRVVAGRNLYGTPAYHRSLIAASRGL
ncbi:acyl-CoA dehydrogenase family protein [Microbacterium sp. SLBN-146]|uniref:acyl-CoA dehydrogenase family protein n=1 Tax=Microbacterium sp. SLBN-146 TaxID=2768457 RepID=UPI00114E0D1A|nr:acyl-CoA dehydrogenase [Microbacterium sp. SLBN-146]TQJ29943.1 alkylation response protein AidB-like acyl-CoA dehydrogenase [Microbacterium sp. SLBN-146]